LIIGALKIFLHTYTHASASRNAVELFSLYEFNHDTIKWFKIDKL